MSVEFSFTGFLPWGKEPSNPSQVLVQSLRASLPPENLPVLYTKVLPVTAQAAYRAITHLHSALSLRRQEYPEKAQVLVHLGLHSASLHMVVERAAKNLAMIKGEVEGRIVKEFEEDHKVFTTLKVPRGVDPKLRDSEDAGNFVCNFTYYLSLLSGLQSGVHVLFIHLPHFDRLSQAEQTRKLALILKGIQADLTQNQ